MQILRIPKSYRHCYPGTPLPNTDPNKAFRLRDNSQSRSFLYAIRFDAYKTTSCTPKWVCSHKCRHRTRFIAGNADLQLFHKARADRYQQHTGQSMTKRQVRTNLSLCMYQQINNFASQRHEIVQISRLLGCIQQHRLFVHWMVVNIFPNDII